eukprot:5353352-Pyramimonas_sp.AAC.1
MSGSGPRLWSKCAKCGTTEWNDILSTRNNQCSKCRCPVKVFKAKPKKDGSADGSQDNSLVHANGSKGDSSASRAAASGAVPDDNQRMLSMLTQLLADAKDMSTKKLLLEQMAALRSSPSPKPVSTEESVKRADSALRDAHAKHDQAVHQVIKLRDNLHKAEIKEAEAAVILARAEAAK